MLNYVEYPSSVKEGTETPGAFDQNGQRFYVLDRLQEQVSRIRYLLDTTVFFRNQLETCQAAGNAEAAQSAYLSLSSGRIGIANGVRSLKPLLLELEHPAASICEALVNQISSFELMTRDYSKFSGGISRFLDALPSFHTVDASTIGRLMNHVKLGHYPTDLTHVGYLERGIVFPDKTVNLLDPCCGTGDAVLRLALGHDSRCYGIELDEERAGLAEQKLFRVAYGDFFSSYVGNRSFHAILLNPPYLTVTLGCGLRGRDEKRFLVEAFQALVMGGLMIYIVPYYRMTEDVCQIFTDNFSDISVYRFLDGEFGKFKQIAVLGTRKPRESDEAASASLYTAALHPESLRTLDQLPEGRYQLPDAALDVKIFRGSVFNESELAHQLMASQSLERLLQKDGQEQEMGRPPLPLSIGQVGLIGGSGLINGLMQCDCPHIIKGRIIKERHERREENHSERGELISTDVIETITNRMVFNILTPTGFRSLV